MLERKGGKQRRHKGKGNKKVAKNNWASQEKCEVKDTGLRFSVQEGKMMESREARSYKIPQGLYRFQLKLLLAEV